MRMMLAGNWKMNGLRASLAEVRALVRGLAEAPVTADVMVCPPATLIAEALKAVEGSRIAVGGQDCRAEASGAYTGDIAPEMLRDAGASAVILGHSERRQYHGETNETVAAKLAGAARAGLETILCVGESEDERNGKKTRAVVTEQLKRSIPVGFKAENLIVAYEPVWAIGSGKTPSVVQIEETHGDIRAFLVKRFGKAGANIRILYGGSVKPSNAEGILKVNEVGGALIGGASLKAADFLAIIHAAPKGRGAKGRG